MVKQAEQTTPFYIPPPNVVPTATRTVGFLRHSTRLHHHHYHHQLGSSTHRHPTCSRSWWILQWEHRRAEIKALLMTHIFGSPPPAQLTPGPTHAVLVANFSDAARGSVRHPLSLMACVAESTGG